MIKKPALLKVLNETFYLCLKLLIKFDMRDLCILEVSHLDCSPVD